MSVLYQDYDAVNDFRKQWAGIIREKARVSNKPKLIQAMTERRALLLETFAAFLNHSLATRYPGKKITAMYADDAMFILSRLSPVVGDRPVPPTFTDVLALLEFDEGEGSVHITRKEQLER